ncbi:hypothetical protein [Bradyrhizobium sp. CSA207]|nr:hypothetical protein [Bradyrhizobium sp. CSA207]
MMEHRPNMNSGAQTSPTAIGQFEHAGRGFEHQPLLQLIGTLGVD